MIQSIKHKGLKALFRDGHTGKIDSRQHDRILILLDALMGATGPEDLVGVSDFHALKGQRKGEYSMHVTGNWVLTFRFEGEDVRDVDYEDYH